VLRSLRLILAHQPPRHVRLGVVGVVVTAAYALLVLVVG